MEMSFEIGTISKSYKKMDAIDMPLIPVQLTRQTKIRTYTTLQNYVTCSSRLNFRKQEQTCHNAVGVKAMDINKATSDIAYDWRKLWGTSPG